MNNNIYIATKPDSRYTFIFEPETITPISSLANHIRYTGHKGTICLHTERLDSWDNCPYAECSWDNWTIARASEENVKWYHACKAAGKFVEKPKVVEFYLVY